MTDPAITETRAATMNAPSKANGTNPGADMLDRAQGFTDEARQLAERARLAFRTIRIASLENRNQALLNLATRLREGSTRTEIMRVNAIDLENGKASGLSPALMDRLRLDEKRIDGMAQAIEEIAAMRDPVGEVISGERLPNGINMVKQRVPMGVVFTIYESRPNVTVDIGALCVKSGNASILRGGREAIESNRILHRLFQEALRDSGLDANAVQLVNETDRAFMLALLQQDASIDLVVPRGGERMIQFIAANTRIPVVKHDKGVCNMFIDESASLEMAIELAQNSKLQRTSVCNALENLIVHRNFPHAAHLFAELSDAGAKLRGDEVSHQLNACVELIPEDQLQDEYATEYLDERLSVRVVDNLDEALNFIALYGSGHSEAIVTEDLANSRIFQSGVDSAAVFVNCSTRFHDGGQMGMGAEVGISTGRLHVRGPMGVKDLTTTTYIMSGDGQIRN